MLASLRNVFDTKQMENPKETVRQALSTCPVPLTHIASSTGIPVARLYNFVSKGSLNGTDVQKVADWLKQSGNLQDEPPPKPAHELIVAEMRALADLLASPDVDKEIKGERFASTVRGWHSGIDKYAAMLKK